MATSVEDKEKNATTSQVRIYCRALFRLERLELRTAAIADPLIRKHGLMIYERNLLDYKHRFY